MQVEGEEVKVEEDANADGADREASALPPAASDNGDTAEAGAPVDENGGEGKAEEVADVELKEEEEEAGDDDGDDDSDGDDDDDDGDGDDDDDDDDDDDEVRLKRPPALFFALSDSDETQKPEWYSKYEAKILWAKVGGYPWWPCYVPHLKDVPSRKHSQETLKSINKGYLWVFALGPRTCWMQVRAIEKKCDAMGR